MKDKAGRVRLPKLPVGVVRKHDFAEPVVDHYTLICPFCKVSNVLYGIPLDLTTRCSYCKKRVLMVLPRHRMVKVGEERGAVHDKGKD